MKLNTFKHIALATLFGLGISSCEDFIDSPS